MEPNSLIYDNLLEPVSQYEQVSKWVKLYSD